MKIYSRSNGVHSLPLLFAFSSRFSALRLRFLPACLLLVLAGVPTHATTVVPPQFEELVAKSDYIVRAVVKSVNAQLHADGPHRHIITQVELDVREVISGTPPQPLVLELLGGKVGAEEMRVDGTPRFQAGDEDILFVHGNGVQFCPLVALMHGRYPIKTNASTGRQFVTRGDGTPLTNEQEVARPMTVAEKSAAMPAVSPAISALTPADFVSRIKTTAAKHAAVALPQP